MDFLISFCDNALIYYPNLFFAVLFFVSILGIVLVVMGIVVLGRKVGKFIKAITSSLKQKKIKEKRKISFAQMASVFFKRKKISLALMAEVTFIRVNKALGYIESQAEKIVKKIGKEIFIKQ